MNEDAERIRAILDDGSCSDSNHDSARQVLRDLWRTDPAQCERAALQAFRACRDPRDLADELALASRELSDPRFDDVLFDLSIQRGVPSNARPVLRAYLVSIGHPGATEQFDKEFRRTCQRFIGEKVDEMTFSTIVQQACLLRRTHLHHNLGETLGRVKEMGKEAPYIHITERRKLESVLVGMREGETGLKAILDGRESTVDQREGAAYALGCECRPELFDYFAALWRRTPPGDYIVRKQCLGAMVYGCDPGRVAGFVADSLRAEREQLERRWLGHWFNRNVGSMRLLLRGATHVRAITPVLEEELRYWLDSKAPHCAVSAYLALEGHDALREGDTVPDVEEYGKEKWFRKEHYNLCDLFTAGRPHARGTA